MSGIIRRLTLSAVVLSIAIVGVAAQDGLGGGQAAMMAKFVWEVPSSVVLPLKALIAKGFMPLERKANAATAPTFVLLKLDTGEPAWQADLTSDVQSLNATDDEVIIATRDKVLGFALADGKTLWEQPLKGRIDTGWEPPPSFAQIQWFRDLRTPGQGIGGGFLVAKGRVMVCVDTVLYALDPKTGKIQWQKAAGWSFGCPLADTAGLVLAATSDQGLRAFDIATGDEKWARTELSGVQPVMVVEDELYCATRDGLHRVDPATGELLWTAKIPADAAEKACAVGDRLVVQRSNDVYIVVRKTGEIVGYTETAGQSSAVGHDCVFYQGKQGGEVVCVTVADVETKWHQASADPGASRLFLAGGVVVALNPGLVQGFDVQEGKRLWKRPSGAGMLFDTSTFAADDRTAYVHVANEMRGYGLRSGVQSLSMIGDFFFVHFMQVMHDTLYLHSGKPCVESMGAIPLKKSEDQ